jgi:hypothetical protein
LIKRFKSGFERTLDAQLKASGVQFEYEPIKLPYVINHVYKPDFVLTNGIIIEAKGYFRRGETAKMLAVKKAHPHLDIRFVFQEPDKHISGQKTTHAQWATRYGFPWADGRIPVDWLHI